MDARTENLKPRHRYQGHTIELMPASAGRDDVLWRVSGPSLEEYGDARDESKALAQAKKAIRRARAANVRPLVVGDTNHVPKPGPGDPERVRWWKLREFAFAAAAGGRPLTASETRDLKRLNEKFLGPMQNPTEIRRLKNALLS